MRVCLIKCPSPFLMEEKVFPPLGLLSIASNNDNIDIYDGPIECIPDNYEYYGVGPSTPEYPYALKILNLLKYKNKKVIIGGPHATLNSHECIKDGFNHVVVGDGENAILNIIKNNSNIEYGKEENLNSYLNINRSLLNIKDYKYYINGKLATTIMTARGCPYKCAFCSKNYTKVRLRISENIIKEIDDLYFNHSYQALMFFDDTFILNKNRTKVVCERLKELNIIWRCFVRADLIVKHGYGFSRMLSDSGCVEVGIGIESGSNSILDNINKGESIETIKSAIDILNRNNIRAKGFFIIGLPGESTTTIEETKRFLDSSSLYDMDFTVFQPYPGSPIYNNKEKYDVDWDKLDYKNMFYKGKPKEYIGFVRTSSLSSDQIIRYREELENTYKDWSINAS